jgi:hypothetical protein
MTQCRIPGLRRKICSDSFVGNTYRSNCKNMGVSPTIQLWSEPPEMSSVPEPVTWASDYELLVSYVTSDSEKVAVLRFKSRCHKFGSPNDEALGGHPLSRYGLKFYEFHVVENSPWLAEMCCQNRVHPRHSDWMFADLRHWIISFQDSTLEVVGREAAVVGVFDSTSPEEALLKVRFPSRNVD